MISDRHNAHVEILAFIVSSQNEGEVSVKDCKQIIILYVDFTFIKSPFMDALMNRKFSINEISIAVS